MKYRAEILGVTDNGLVTVQYTCLDREHDPQVLKFKPTGDVDADIERFAAGAVGTWRHREKLAAEETQSLLDKYRERQGKPVDNTYVDPAPQTVERHIQLPRST